MLLPVGRHLQVGPLLSSPGGEGWDRLARASPARRVDRGARSDVHAATLAWVQAAGLLRLSSLGPARGRSAPTAHLRRWTGRSRPEPVWPGSRSSHTCGPGAVARRLSMRSARPERAYRTRGCWCGGMSVSEARARRRTRGVLARWLVGQRGRSVLVAHRATLPVERGDGRRTRPAQPRGASSHGARGRRAPDRARGPGEPRASSARAVEHAFVPLRTGGKACSTGRVFGRGRRTRFCAAQGRVVKRVRRGWSSGVEGRTRFCAAQDGW